MFTTLYITFSDVQGQITLVLVVVSGRNLNSYKLLCMPSLSARMRMIKSKMKEPECSQDFSHYSLKRKSFTTLTKILVPFFGPKQSLSDNAIDKSLYLPCIQHKNQNGVAYGC